MSDMAIQMALCRAKEIIYAQLGLTESPDKFSEAVFGKLNPGHKIGEPAPLFPRKDI